MDRVDRWSQSVTRRDVVRGAVALGFGAVALGSQSLMSRRVFAESAPALNLAEETTDLKDLDTKELVKAIKSSKFSQANVAATIEALARAGIPVFAEANSPEPMLEIEGEVSPLRFLEWQVRSMALEVSTRGGSLGSELDELYPAEDGAPAISSWLGGYAATAVTPGAEIAQVIMGKRNWKNAADAPFPMIVPALFASDIAMESRSTESENARSMWSLAAGCGGMQEFVDDAVANALDALVANGGKGGSVINNTLDYLNEIGALDPEKWDSDTAEALRQVREIAALLAIASEAITLVKPWSVRVGAAPSSTRFGVGGEIIEGEVSASVDFGGTTEWPGDLLSCASENGISLPPLTANEAPIEWAVTERPIPLINFSELPNKLDDAGAATFHYITNNESEEDAKGEPMDGRLTVKAMVQRDDLNAARQVIFGAIFQKLFQLKSLRAEDSLWSRIRDLDDQLMKLAKGTGMGLVTVTFHVKEEEEEDQGLDKGLFGNWEVTDISAALTDQLNSLEFGGPPMYFEGQAGSQIFHFGRDGVFAVSADGFTAVGGADDEFGHVDVGIEYNGSAGGTYTADGDTLTFNYSDFSQMSTSISMSINGTSMNTSPLDPEQFFAQGSVPYERNGKTLNMWTYGLNGVPIVLKKV